MNYITRYAIGLKLSEYDVGQYSSLSSVIVVMSTLAGAIFVVFIPEISLWRNQGKWGRIRRLILWVLLFMALAGVAAVIVGKLLGAFVCVLIFGEEILDNIDLLIPLLITATLLMIKRLLFRFTGVNSAAEAIINRRVLWNRGMCTDCNSSNLHLWNAWRQF